MSSQNKEAPLHVTTHASSLKGASRKPSSRRKAPLNIDPATKVLSCSPQEFSDDADRIRLAIRAGEISRVEVLEAWPNKFEATFVVAPRNFTHDIKPFTFEQIRLNGTRVTLGAAPEVWLSDAQGVLGKLVRGLLPAEDIDAKKSAEIETCATAPEEQRFSTIYLSALKNFRASDTKPGEPCLIVKNTITTDRSLPAISVIAKAWASTSGVVTERSMSLTEFGTLFAGNSVPYKGEPLAITKYKKTLADERWEREQPVLVIVTRPDFKLKEQTQDCTPDK